MRRNSSNYWISSSAWIALQVSGDYLMQCMEALSHRLGECEDPLYLCAALVGLMVVTWCHRLWYNNGQGLVDIVNNCCQKIADLMPGIVSDQFQKQLFHKLGGDRDYHE